MKTVVLEKPGKFALKEAQKPDAPGPGKALLKVKKIGVCGTDIHAFGGNQPFFTYPRILGHELAVEVIETGEDVSNIKKGDFCTVEPYYNPEKGQAVMMGKPNCGESLTVFGVHEDGGMQEYITYPAEYLYTSSVLDLEQLALIEPLAIGCHAVDRGEVESSDIVLVIGAGPIGLAAIQFAQLTGARVIAMDIDEGRLEYAKNKMQVKETINASEDVHKQLDDLMGDYRPTIVLDATGNGKSMMSSFDYVSHGGRVVFIGLIQGKIEFDDPKFHKKELTLKATRAAMGADFSRIIRLVEAGLIEPQNWITHYLDFEDVPQEFENIGKTKEQTIKAIINLD